MTESRESPSSNKQRNVVSANINSDRPTKRIESINIKDAVFSYVDSNIRWIRYGVYGLGVVGVVLIIRATRSTQVFRCVSEIPESYVSRNVTLQGSVDKVGSDCNLRVLHKPIISMWRAQPTSADTLSVHLAGIEASPAGRKWLIDNAKGKHVWFRLLERSCAPPHVQCDVTLKTGILSKVLLNEELVRSGLCRVRDYETPPTSFAYIQVIDRLVAIEAREERKKSSPVRRLARSVKSVFHFLARIPKSVSGLVLKRKRRDQ